MSGSNFASVLVREQEYFDREAKSLTDAELRIPSPAAIARYARARLDPCNGPKEALFARMLPVAGKRVLDYGCGHGENACLLAACGATVTAFDLSPLSVEVSRRRAEVHGLGERIQFDVRAAGRTGYAPGSFDVVTGFGILHHVHPLLPEVFQEIRALLKPGGAAYFVEPVANSLFLRMARRLVPISTLATPDERQLHDHDFAPLHQLFSRVDYFHFRCLARASRFAGERVTRGLTRADFHLQRFFPFVRRYYGTVVVVAHCQPAESGER